jgi:hypothetical protein
MAGHVKKAVGDCPTDAAMIQRNQHQRSSNNFKPRLAYSQILFGIMNLYIGIFTYN